MSLATEDFLRLLNTIQYNLFHYLLPIFIAFGTLGNLFNLIVFLQPYLRTNPCSIYLLAYTIASICWIDFVALTSSLALGFSIDVGVQSLAVCRIRTYTVYVVINLLPGLLILAAFDRTCVSSRRALIRQYSTRKVAAYSITAITLFWLLFNIPALLYTEVVQLPTGGEICTPLPDNPFNRFIFVFFAISDGLLPPIILIVLGSITLSNLVSFLRSILPVSELCQYRPSRKEQQLILMLLTQIFVTVVCQIPSSAYQIYAVVTRDGQKSEKRMMIELFLYNVLVLLLFVPSCVSFYVYFVMAKTFRNEFYRVMKRIACLEH